MSGPVQKVIDALDAAGCNPKRNGSGWTSGCPGHDDKHPSLSITEGTDGRVLLKDHAGCSTEEIVKALGLTMADLFSPRQNGATTTTPTRYRICDRAGNLVAIHVRLDGPGGKRMWWERGGKHGLNGLRVTDLPLYGAEAVASDEGAIFVVEGEKACDALRAHGVAAVATVCGAAATPSAEVLTVLAGRDVVLWPDNDDLGRQHMARIAQRLQGVAASVRVFPWPNAPEKGDAADFFDQGSTRDDVIALLSQVAWLVTTTNAALIETKEDEPRQAEGAAPVRHANTDLGNAERFAHQHGNQVRHCATWGTWLVWDGQRWARDRDGEVYRLANTTVRSIYSEAASLNNDEQRKALAAHATRSESESRIEAMLDLVKHIKPIATVPETFDGVGTNFLLNVANGTVDLKSGSLLSHRSEDYITKLAPVMFDPEAKSELWNRFLERQVPDPDLRAFLQRAVGYTLTGDTGEEKLLFIHGPEAAGKSTFTEAVKAVLGEYAATANFEAFLRKRGDGGVRDDIARLVGTRMVLSLEVDEGRHLAEALVKNITGGDTVTARHLYSSYFEYKPAFKLWLVANHQPKANAEDGALWRRIMLVPFTLTIPEAERDPLVKQMLTQDADTRSAILAWAVQGCREWLRTRLQPPAAVRDATKSYRDACDHVGDFLNDWEGRPEKVTAADLRLRYETWCKSNGEKPAPAQSVAAALKRRGFVSDRDTGGVRVWRYQGQTESRGVTQ